ncbi:MAG: cation-transporting P-type ATPase [Rhodobacteraceae bacterium]|nr:MAG: cation-transporting P-type ATPase [Paracoccaceae bacterium]
MPPLIPDTPHAKPAEELTALMSVSPERGLSAEEVARRQTVYGPNHLRQRKPRNLLSILLAQFQSVVVYLLAAAAALALAMGDLPEALAILVVLLINGLIGFLTEAQATRSMEALRHLTETRCRVRRDGQDRMVAAQELVPGDIVVLEAGDVVTADLRLIRCAGMQADESILTGEAVPVDKDSAPVPADTDLAERRSMAWKGTAITRGTGEGLVIGTGMETEIGRISRLVQEAQPEATPLESRLDRLGQKLVWLMLALAGVTIIAGLLRGHPLGEIVQTGVALAIAAVPEGLPVVATLCLARGMWRMARRNAVINRLSSVETLGATTLILTDKTGTLTENRMTVVRYLTEDGEHIIPPGTVGPPAPGSALELAMRIGALCNSADISEHAETVPTGDPMEVALLSMAQRAGLAQGPDSPVTEHAFDPERMMMAHVHAEGAGCLYAVKGAPEAVIATAEQELTPEGPRPLSPETRADWRSRAQAMASEGLRCLALAMKHDPLPDAAPYAGLTLVALVALADPLRADIPDAIAACHRAGIRVIMLTGDHAATATRIASDASIGDGETVALTGKDLAGFDPAQLDGPEAKRIAQSAVFARVTPETKLALVRFFQNAGHVVAMTGDGVNDAPALRKADIGIAMGQRGTEVAREAADVVLRDDSFATIIAAVREGRIIFDNIRKFVVYLMSCNISEVLVVGLAVGAGLPAPLLPLQILFLNLVTDIFPAFALGLSRGDASVLERAPRDPAEPIMRRADWRRVIVLGGAITLATIAAFLLALRHLALPPHQAVTVAFLTLALAQLWNVFNARAPGRRALRDGDIDNPYVWGAIALCLLLIAGAVLIPSLATLLQLPYPGHIGVLLALGMSLVPLIFGAAYLVRAHD